MRSFTDAAGQAWQAALLEASYGNITLVFSPLRGASVCQRWVGAENLAEAEQWLAALAEEELRAQLADSEPWDPAAGQP